MMKNVNLVFIYMLFSICLVKYFFLFSLFLHILIINPMPVPYVGSVSFHSSNVFNFLCGVFHHTEILDN